jgi:hypothetical protein
MSSARCSTRATAWLSAAEEAVSARAAAVSASHAPRPAGRRASTRARTATVTPMAMRTSAVRAKVVSK